MSKDSAATAKNASEMTEQAAKDAQVGQESMQKLVMEMENINEVSKEIQNIIGAIEIIRRKSRNQAGHY